MTGFLSSLKSLTTPRSTKERRLADGADVDDIPLLNEVAAIADRHHLHFAVARLAGAEVGEDLHVADVHAAVEVGDAVRTGMAVVVGESGEWRTDQGQPRARGGSQEAATRGCEDACCGFWLGVGLRLRRTGSFLSFHALLLGLGPAGTWPRRQAPWCRR